MTRMCPYSIESPEGKFECIERKCMAWQPPIRIVKGGFVDKHEFELASMGKSTPSITNIDGYCKCIGEPTR